MARKLSLLLLGLQLLYLSIHSLASMPCWTDKRPPSRSLWRVCWYTKHTDSQSWELIPLVFGAQLVNKAANNSFIFSQHSSIHSTKHMVEETNSDILIFSPRVKHIISLDPNIIATPSGKRTWKLNRAAGHKPHSWYVSEPGFSPRSVHLQMSNSQLVQHSSWLFLWIRIDWSMFKLALLKSFPTESPFQKIW